MTVVNNLDGLALSSFIGEKEIAPYCKRAQLTIVHSDSIDSKTVVGYFASELNQIIDLIYVHNKVGEENKSILELTVTLSARRKFTEKLLKKLTYPKPEAEVMITKVTHLKKKKDVVASIHHVINFVSDKKEVIVGFFPDEISPMLQIGIPIHILKTFIKLLDL